MDVPAKKCRLLNQEMLAHLKNDDEKIVITTILIIAMAIKQTLTAVHPMAAVVPKSKIDLTQDKHQNVNILTTSGALISGDLPPGPTPLVTGAGQRVTITAFPHQVDIITIINIII